MYPDPQRLQDISSMEALRAAQSGVGGVGCSEDRRQLWPKAT